MVAARGPRDPRAGRAGRAPRHLRRRVPVRAGVPPAAQPPDARPRVVRHRDAARGGHALDPDPPLWPPLPLRRRDADRAPVASPPSLVRDADRALRAGLYRLPAARVRPTADGGAVAPHRGAASDEQRARALVTRRSREPHGRARGVHEEPRPHGGRGLLPRVPRDDDRAAADVRGARARPRSSCS